MTDLEICDVMISNVYTRYKRNCEETPSRFYSFTPDNISVRCEKHRLSLSGYTSNAREITREEAVVLSVMEM